MGLPSADVPVAGFHAGQNGGVEQLSGLVAGVRVRAAASRAQLKGEVEDVLSVTCVTSMASRRP